ncbi:MAG: hypothetical protein ACK2T3_14785 [Candidatus Promineifilaceae bacterium]
MCCLFTILILLGPRVANIVWWIADSSRWSETFNSVLWPILGIAFAPWTTLAYVFAREGGISGFDVVILMIAIVADVLSYAGGGYGNRKRFRS